MQICHCSVLAKVSNNIKAADWLGVRYENHIATKTNNPMAGIGLMDCLIALTLVPSSE